MGLLSVAPVSIGCQQSGPPPIRLGVDKGLEPLGLARFLVTGFEAEHGVKVRIRYGDVDELLTWSTAGALDVVLMVSEDAMAALEAEGLPIRTGTYAHEELVLIGPVKDALGRYGQASGPELLRNIARANHRYLKAKRGSVERARHDRLFRLSKDRAQPGSFFDSDVQGVAFVERAIDSQAFAFVKRSSLLQAIRAGRKPHRIYRERDPALVVRLMVAEIHPAKAKRPTRPELFDYVMGEAGRKAIESFGADRFGYPLFGPGAPPPGEGAGVPGLDRSSPSGDDDASP